MGYKVLGFVVWQGGKWYMRRRFRGVRRKVALAGLSAVIGAGLLAAARQSASE